MLSVEVGSCPTYKELSAINTFDKSFNDIADPFICNEFKLAIPDDVIVVNVPAAAELPPITAPSTVPPLISAVSATNESMFAVPSINKSCHSAAEDPKSKDPSDEGSKSEPSVLDNVTV